MTLIDIYEELCANAVKNGIDPKVVDLDLATFVKVKRTGGDTSHRWSDARQRMHTDTCKKIGIDLNPEISTCSYCDKQHEGLCQKSL